MPLTRRTPLRRSGFGLRRTRLRPCSYRQKRRLEIYYEKRKAFLARPENQWCPVAWSVFGIRLRTTDIHHRLGRIGPLLLDENHWMALSRQGHEWVHQFPASARARGFLG